MPYESDPKKAAEQDMSIKFDGRTIMLTVFVNTDEDIKTVSERVTDAAKGPHGRMSACEAGVYTDKRWTLALWTEIKKGLLQAGVKMKKGDG